MDDQIRAVIDGYGGLSVAAADLADDADLYQAGLTSHATVNVMLALEEEFHVEFPDSLLRRGTFHSIAAIREAVSTLTDTLA
jgi:acyl carrier protein